MYYKKKLFVNGFLLSFTLLFIYGCGSIRYDHKQKMTKYRKSNEYYIDNKHGGKSVDYSKLINTNISSVNEEELMFLEDVEMKFINHNDKKVAYGRKIYTKNKLTTEFFSWDRPDLMGEIGQCRARQTTQLADLADDGKINGSVKFLCNMGRKFFQVGKMKFEEYGYSYLEDWHGDDFRDALYAFLNSCKAFKGNKPVASKTFSIGTEADWRELCNIGLQYYKAGYEKLFFDRYFSPFRIKEADGKDTSKFTGYYVWELPVSMSYSSKYRYPIYSMPPECKANQASCPSRVQINNGALAGRGLEIGWASNPMDIYFMQVQGSGVGVMENGQSVRYNYAGKNGQKFATYSEYIKQHPGFCPVSGYGNTIDWLNNHPSEALQATSVCSSYVFFAKKSGLEPVLGAQGTPLTQSRSIAIDTTYIPYGVPMWIQTHIAVVDVDNHDEDKWIDWNRLYIAQDTGSAIKGIVRADLYMGHGRKGEYIAKNQNFPGEWFILIPNSLINKIR